VLAIAGTFGVDVVDLYDLPEAAAEYGSPLPADLLPRSSRARSVLVGT
jgi:hypothetical protein